LDSRGAALSYELVNTVSSLGTFIVIGASAVAAVVQLRHMRAATELQAVLSVEKDFRSGELQEALRYVQSDLPFRMRDAKYRAELEAIGFADARTHLELNVLNWFNELGTLLKNKIVAADPFMDMFGRLVVHYWDLLAPVVAVMRRKRGESQYHNFEYLALCARAWMAEHPAGLFPGRMHRAEIPDPWREDDAGLRPD
jgi:hypothetical protein